MQLNNNYILRGILAVALLFWMSVIFGFSSAEGETSQSTSDIITEIIVEQFVDDYYSMAEVEQQEIWNQISFVVRKTGHFCEYAILGVLSGGFLLTFTKIKKDKIYMFIAVAGCIFYAITDEIHQAFVDGRSSKITDVLIDSAGAIFGIVIITCIYGYFSGVSQVRNKGCIGYQ